MTVAVGRPLGPLFGRAGPAAAVSERCHPTAGLQEAG
jgi:hypothetical protein